MARRRCGIKPDATMPSASSVGIRRRVHGTVFDDVVNNDRRKTQPDRARNNDPGTEADALTRARTHSREILGVGLLHRFGTRYGQNPELFGFAARTARGEAVIAPKIGTKLCREGIALDARKILFNEFTRTAFAAGAAGNERRPSGAACSGAGRPPRPERSRPRV